jgi:hypothetical protein
MSSSIKLTIYLDMKSNIYLLIQHCYLGGGFSVWGYT